MSTSNEKMEEQLVAAEENPQSGADRSPEEREEAYRRLQADRDALFERLARTQAEFENYRKRARREQADFRDYAVTDAAKSLLPVLDSFDLALASHGEQDSELRKGVELIRKQLDEALTKMGVRPIPAVGEPFDPHFHEAIEMVETADAEDNHVIGELQRGYKIKDRLLRPARVRVAKNHK